MLHKFTLCYQSKGLTIFLERNRSLMQNCEISEANKKTGQIKRMCSG